MIHGDHHPKFFVTVPEVLYDGLYDACIKIFNGSDFIFQGTLVARLVRGLEVDKNEVLTFSASIAACALPS